MARMARNGDSAGFGRVPELSMTPLRGNQVPSICLYQLDDITHLHLTKLRMPTSIIPYP